VHPHDAAAVDERAWPWFVETARDPRVLAIGETGLDFDRLFSPADVQLSNLRRNLALALETGKPAILHCRSAEGSRDGQDTLVAELRRAGFDDAGVIDAFGGRPAAIVHSYSGPMDYAEAVLDLGLAVSFSGLVFRPGEESSAEFARRAPVDRVLVETDSPFLSPPGAPRRRNEPEYVEVNARWLADRRGDDPEELGQRLVANYDRIFGRPIGG
jgi:TatD DNase family protein